MKTVNAAAIFAALCLLLVSCKEKENQDIENRLSPTLVSMPEDSSVLFTKLGFSYSTLEEAEQKIATILDSSSSHRNASWVNTNDELTELIKNDPATFNYDFPILQAKDYVTIVTSDDGNLRFYYWDTGMGGTMIDWGNLCQFRTCDSIYVYECGIYDICSMIQDEYTIGCATMGIYTVQADSGETYYLVHIYVREAGNLGFAEIIPVKIENGSIAYADIFNSEDNSSEDYGWVENSTFREYTFADWYFRTNHGEGWKWIYQFDKNSQTFYVPEVIYGDITDRYDLYRFDGQKFIYVGMDGGFWLHPSIRSFMHLEVLFCTEDYRIRIDMMQDSTYRYTSWGKNTSMDKQPDIVIYNGTYDDSLDEFSFENDGFRYIVNTDLYESRLSVMHNGKRLLYQKNVVDYGE